MYKKCYNLGAFWLKKLVLKKKSADNKKKHEKSSCVRRVKAITKLQNFKKSSAANFRWHFKDLKCAYNLVIYSLLILSRQSQLLSPAPLICLCS